MPGSSTNPKRNHHINPRLYLKGFTIPHDEHSIWVYRRGEPYRPKPGSGPPNPHKTSISVAGSERDFYACPKADGEIDYDTFENRFAQLETPSDAIFAKLRGRETITDEEKRTFAQYIVLMLRRVAPYRNSLTTPISNILQTYEDNLELHALIRHADEERRREIIRAEVQKISDDPDLNKKTHLEIISAAEASRMVEPLFKMAWHVYVAPKGETYLTSDNPVYVPKLGLNKNISELSFPLSSSLSLVASWRKQSKRFYHDAIPQYFKELNRRTAAIAHQQVYSSELSAWVVKVFAKDDHMFRPLYHEPMHELFRV